MGEKKELLTKLKHAPMKETWGFEIDFSNTWALKKILQEEQDGGHTVVLTAC